MAKSGAERQQQKNEHVAKLTFTNSNCAPIPQVVDPARRESCREDLRLFCETYYPAVFNLAWSADHLRVIQIIQNAILFGGLFAVAMPRGNGKTALCVAAAVWALLFGHRCYVVLIGATDRHATKLLKSIRIDLRHNDLLAEDFPEVCWPVRALNGKPQACAGQHVDGRPTLVGWTDNELILPTVEGSVASGAVVAVAGITGGIRGMTTLRPHDGAKIRPDFCLIDDPQTKESATSPKQVEDRLAIVSGDILGLAGPDVKISAVMPVTVIAKGDLADQVLDRTKNPIWQGVKTKLLNSEPTNAKLWEEYAAHWAKGHREERGLEDATAFYVANREAMDAGADAAWPARHNADEVSAIQHAMNLKLRDEGAFAAEYQNEPLSLDADAPIQITAEDIAAKTVDSLKRGIVPQLATRLTAFCDVQGSILYYAVVATDEDFGGHVVDYGTYPEQPRGYFFLREVQNTLAMAKPGTTAEGQLYDGLTKLADKLLDRKWQTQVGGEMSISRLIIDAGYMDGVVKQFCRDSRHASRLLASKGFGVKADILPMNEWGPKPGFRTGWNWRVTALPDRYIQFDTYEWHTFAAKRLLMAPGVTGTITIFSGSEGQHRMFCDQNASEYPVPTEGKGRMVNVWKLRPNAENHLGDCLIGALVAASEQGATAEGHQPATGQITRKRRQVVATF